MNERRKLLIGNKASVITFRVTTIDGSTNVGICMTVTNGNKTYSITTDSQGKAELTGLSGGYTISCTTHEIDTSSFIATSTMIIDISAYVNTFPVGEVRSYNYTGNVSEVRLIPGQYTLQVWGAQGGSNAAAAGYGISSMAGGKGGYSTGNLTVTDFTTVQVVVGGQGTSSAGGYNGGGSTTGSSTYNAGGVFGISTMGGGGGASDIRLSSNGALSRMIVAGGGSGGAMCYNSTTTQVTNYTNVLAVNLNSFYWRNSWSNVDETFVSDYSFPFSNGGTYRVYSSPTVYAITIQFCVNGSYGEYYNFGNGSGSVQTIYFPSGYSDAKFILYSSSGHNVNIYVDLVTTGTSTSTATSYQAGFAGGGSTGLGYSSAYQGKQNAAGSGGSFGSGANQTATSYRYCSGAGGGGWYGGGGGQMSDGSMEYCKYSGGGSGFVNTSANASYRPSGYTGLQLDSGTTYSGNQSFPNTAGTGNETGHSGNGYAKITRIS